MLCELASYSDSFLATWLLIVVGALLLTFSTSGPVFYYYYWPSQVTYEKWQYKSNVKFPTPEKVRDEIIAMAKGLTVAAICPTLSLYLAARGMSKAYCGWGGYSIYHHVGMFFFVLIISDLFEYMYHRLGHTTFRFWDFHKHHHVFYNPSPFAVVADEWVDQFMRATPLLIFPLIMPINIDVMFAQFAFQFYIYGVYLHWGYESKYISAHNPVINSSFQHYCHHAKSLMNSPYHCGFHIKLWDQIFNTCYPREKCFCAECSRNKGERTIEAYEKVTKPDYSQLLSLKMWAPFF